MSRDFSQVELRTARLRLRPLREGDADALFAIYSDAEVARYLTSPAWKDMAPAHARIARNLEALPAGRFLALGLERIEDGALLGECSLFELNDQCRRAELGYTLGRAAWGRGYMNEALQALLAYAFGELELLRLEADIDPRNLPSARQLERLGFKLEGLLRERWIVAGEVSDSGLYGLLAREWKALNGASNQ